MKLEVLRVEQFSYGFFRLDQANPPSIEPL